MNELQIIVNQQRGVISTNFEDIKQELSAQMQIYKELETTEANKAERKKDIATLRKMKTAIKDKRIEVKKECLKPYDVYEKLSDELEEIINEPISIIDNQVKEFEEQQRLIKIEDINKLFDSMIDTYPTLKEEIGIVVIYDNRWENATASMKSVKDDMVTKLNTIRDNVALINTMVSDKTEEALRLFWGDLDVAKAMGMITRYEAQKREIEQRMIEQQRIDREAEEERQRASRERELEREKQKVRDEEVERIRRENSIRAEAEQKAREEEEAKTKAKEAAELEAMQIQKQSNASKSVNVTYFIEGTPEELEQIEMYMNSIGVEYEKL